MTRVAHAYCRASAHVAQYEVSVEGRLSTRKIHVVNRYRVEVWNNEVLCTFTDVILHLHN